MTAVGAQPLESPDTLVRRSKEACFQPWHISQQRVLFQTGQSSFSDLTHRQTPFAAGFETYMLPSLPVFDCPQHLLAG